MTFVVSNSLAWNVRRVVVAPTVVQLVHWTVRCWLGVVPLTSTRASVVSPVTVLRSSQNGAMYPLGVAVLGIATFEKAVDGVPVPSGHTCRKPFDVTE